MSCTGPGAIAMSSSTLNSALFYLTVAVVLLVAVRIVLAVIGWFIRRRYNLTVAETSGSARANTPSFLETNAESRADTIAAGAAFTPSAETATPDNPDAHSEAHPVTRYARLSRMLSVVVALLTLATSVVGAATSVELFDGVAQRFSGWDRFVELVRTHWFGASIVAMIIISELYRFTVALRHPRGRYPGRYPSR